MFLTRGRTTLSQRFYKQVNRLWVFQPPEIGHLQSNMAKASFSKFVSTQKIVFFYRSLQPAPAAPVPPPGAPAAPPPTYPTQYPTIAKAQYPNEFFTTMGGGAAGANVTTPAPMVAYSSGLGAPQRGTLFTTQQQVTPTQSYHPYRRQP